MIPQNSPELVLLAHGSRDKNWCDTFEDGLAVINARLAQPASLAYMEMASPSLESVVGGHYLRGSRHIAILPLFFAEGRHLLHDVPARIATLTRRHPGIRIDQLQAVGRQRAFWDVIGAMIAGGGDMAMATKEAVNHHGTA